MPESKQIDYPFNPKRLQEDRDKDEVKKITTKFNKEEQARLKRIKKYLLEPKDGTAIKQALEIVDEVRLNNFINKIIDIKLKNQKRNLKSGILDFD